VKRDDERIDLIIGLGETGRPLKEILEEKYPVCGRDVEPLTLPGEVRVLHICYPFDSHDFVGTSVNYIREYRPELTIIHATVVTGTTLAIKQQVDCLVAYSPIRGKHTRMREELLRYTKFVAGTTAEAAAYARDYLAGAGLTVKLVSKCEALELAKLIETTYFGLLIAWAQEVERLSRQAGADYDEVMALTEEVGYLPPVVFRPGFIGGHCIIPNTYLLDKLSSSPFVDLIRSSNEIKRDEWNRAGKDLNERIAPRPVSSPETSTPVT
jgi:UDP-N-acetyl-D-mannosaminuronate dehydrogenase